MDTLRESEFLCCMAGDAGVGIGVDAVQEVFETRLLTRLPGCPEVLMGLANLRGSVVPVLNPWGLPSPPGAVKRIAVLKTAEGPVGLLITRLLDLFRFENFCGIDALPQPIDRTAHCFDAVAESPEAGRVHLLNVERMIAETLPQTARKG
ncbi:MAG: chemotaxis protein CheW [Fibrobacterota bacterium]